MGNFCTYGRFNLRGMRQFAPITRILIHAGGEFISGQLIPVYQTKKGGPKIDLKLRVISVVQKLTKKDFPESKLLIDDSGFITYLGE